MDIGMRQSISDGRNICDLSFISSLDVLDFFVLPRHVTTEVRLGNEQRLLLDPFSAGWWAQSAQPKIKFLEYSSSVNVEILMTVRNKLEI